jgi:hypothetical protein
MTASAPGDTIVAPTESSSRPRDGQAQDETVENGRAQDAAAEVRDAFLSRWQNRLLPFMLGAVIFMTLFFLFASLWVFYDFRQRVADSALNLEPVFAEYERTYLPRSAEPLSAYLRWKTTILLEQELIARRYKQVNSVILARIWTRYLGFLTGMTLALVGAFFVLGQLRTDKSSLAAKGQGFEASLTTSSPGLLLATLGTILMAISLIVTFDFETRDQPTYVRQPSSSEVTMPPPGIMPEGGDRPSPRKTPADVLIEAAPAPGGGRAGQAQPKK